MNKHVGPTQNFTIQTPKGTYSTFRYNNPYGQVHLISSDLWEAITGEKALPSTICEICANSIQANEGIPPQLFFSAKDRNGSRTLQQNIENCSYSERQSIFNTLFPYFFELSQDSFGNYVIQKLCEKATDEQQDLLLESIIKNPLLVNFQNGCRVIQKFIETTSINKADKIFETFRKNLIHLCFSQNGNHLVQRFVELLPERLTEIIDIILPFTNKLVVDNCGCRVVQKMFDIYPINKLTPLVEKIIPTADQIANDQYGNYVIQNILQNGSTSNVVGLLKSFKGHFYEFSIHKFASNVIEKCIRRANSSQRNEIFEEIIGKNGHFDEKRIFQMVSDQFGNYVIQRILEFGTDEQQEAIFNVVDKNYDNLISKGYAKHVISRLTSLGFDF